MSPPRVAKLGPADPLQSLTLKLKRGKSQWKGIIMSKDRAWHHLKLELVQILCRIYTASLSSFLLHVSSSKLGRQSPPESCPP